MLSTNSFPTDRPVLFDLDGTLVESGPSITASLRHAMREMDGPEFDDATLESFIGPPLRVGLRDIAGFHGEQLEKTLAIYMAHQLESGMAIVEPYDGIRELVSELHAAGVPLAVATSKRTENAIQVMNNTDLARYFQVISGAEPDRLEKRHSIETALAGLAKTVDTKNAIMIGDRIYDIDGAAHFDMPCIAVTWGYGTKDEWQRADHTVETIAELRALLEKGL